MRRGHQGAARLCLLLVLLPGQLQAQAGPQLWEPRGLRCPCREREMLVQQMHGVRSDLV